MYMYEDDSTRCLAYWLNPTGENVLSLNGISYPELDPDLDPSLVDLKVYPNPTTDGIIHVKTTFSGDLFLELYDYMGNLHYKDKINIMASFDATIPLGNLNSGIYLLRLRYGSVEFIKRILFLPPD
jgi:hypothetical protein